MCGIAGIFNNNFSDLNSLENDLRRMLSVIHHRGPDESGIYVHENFGMAHSRLSILDLKTGSQPMCDESGNYWIVFNGEIFNADELRSTLEKKGKKFRTASDTEVIVQMYAQYGSDCLQYLNGQFALCIWNLKEKELFMARDRVGICPLFYWNQHNSIAFCSEMKGLFTLNFVPKSISPKGLSQIFTFWTTLPGQTPFEAIHQLPPGCYMTFKEGKLDIRKYWDLRFTPSGDLSFIDLNEAVEQLRELLSDAVRIRLKADVKVGAYLSGGLDSSITTAFIKENSNAEKLNTFSIGFEEKEFDESVYQKEVSGFFNTHHLAFKCTPEEILGQFEKTIWHTEFPILRTSPVPMMLLSQKVHEQGFKVVITGEGADEFLGGYNIFKESKIRRFWANQPQSSIRPWLLSRLYPYLSFLQNPDNSLAARTFFGYKLQDTNNPLYSHLLRWHNTSRITNLFSKDLKAMIADYDPLTDVKNLLPHDFNEMGDLAKSQYLEIMIFMSDYLLSSQGDRMLMANGVEGRFPFLDHRVIEFCNNLPERFKLNGLNEKFILKKISEGKIPKAIAQRVKQPYRAPINSVFYTPENFKYVQEILSDKSIDRTGLFDSEKVRLFIKRISLNQNVSELDNMALTGVLSTQIMYKSFIGKSA